MASELRVDKIVPPVDGVGIDSSTVKYAGCLIQIV